MSLKGLIVLTNLLIMFVIISLTSLSNNEKSFIAFALYYGLLIGVNTIVALILQITGNKIGSFYLGLLFCQIILFLPLLLWVI